MLYAYRGSSRAGDSTWQAKAKAGSMKRGGFLKRTPFKRPDPFGLRKRSKKSNRVQYKEEQWKKAVRARDGFQCQFPTCFTRSRSIDVHHIAMRSRRPDLKFVQDNGVCLCRQHHNWCHANQGQAIAMGLLSADSYEKAKKELAA